MYKIMTKLHTSAENVYAFHMATNDDGEIVEYKVETPEEAATTALELLGRVGYEDLRIVDDKSYYLDLIYGKKPTPVENLYVLTFIGYPITNKIKVELEPIVDDSMGVNPLPDVHKPEDEWLLKVDNVKENATVNVRVTFEEPVQSFHLIIDNKEYKTGFPDWILYKEYDEVSCQLSFTGITRDHKIEIVIDDPTFIDPPKPKELRFTHVPEGLAELKAEYYNKYTGKVITPEDPEFDHELYVEIGDTEEVETIKLNDTEYDLTNKYISIGNNGQISMPVFEIYEGKLYVSLLHMVAEARNNKVSITHGNKIDYATLDNEPGKYTLNIVEASEMNTQPYSINEIKLSGNVIKVKSDDGRHGVYIDIAANNDVLNDEDLVIYRIDQNKNMGITTVEKTKDGNHTYGVYPKWKNGGYTADDAGEYKFDTKLIIAGKGSIEFTVKLTAIAKD